MPARISGEYDDIGLAIQDLVGGRLDAVICVTIRLPHVLCK